MAKKRRTQVMYMAIELDRLEYCCAYFDDLKSLAEWSGLSISVLRYYLHYNFVDFKNNVRYIKVIY